jgi:hypothetical protein
VRELGPDSPHALAIRHLAALWRAQAGDIPGAIDTLTDVLARRERVLGSEHCDTKATRRAVAYWRSQ